MGNRIIKDTIRTSKTINQMTDFQFRVWVYLITYVDDYGRGSADTELIKGFVFPRRKRISESDIEKVLAELAGMGCINLYSVDGESYFYFPNWGIHQRIQTKKSKFPAPEDADIPCFSGSCGKSPSSTVGNGELPPEFESESESEFESEIETKSPPAPQGQDWGFGPDLTEAFSDWLVYKKEKRQSYKPTGLKALVTEVRRYANQFGEPVVADLIRKCMSCNWTGIIWEKLKNQNSTSQDKKSWTDLAREVEGKT